MADQDTFILHRSLRDSLPEAYSAAGPYITDRAGRDYVDACGGAAVSCLGHAHPKVVAAVREQVGRLDYVHSSFFTNRPAEDLAAVLIKDAPTGLRHVCLVGDGSEAMEVAIKIARQYFVEIGKPERHHFIARRQSYHGNTLGALSVSGNMARKRIYQPLLFNVSHISPCYAYREQRRDESEVAYGIRVASELEAEILSVGPEKVAAFVAEPVVGATLGSVPPVSGYFRHIREICDRYGILLIFDEVMCGLGRTGTLHACTQEGVSPDIMTVAKGLGGGVQPIGATIVSSRVSEALQAGSGTLIGGHTYMAHPVACAAALAVQTVLAEEQIVSRVQKLGTYLQACLRNALEKHPQVGDLRGRGLFFSLEFVKDRDSKTPFPQAELIHRQVRKAAMDRGLLVYAMGGTIDGEHGDHIMLAPPYTIDEPLIDEIVDRLEQSVLAVLGSY